MAPFDCPVYHHSTNEEAILKLEIQHITKDTGTRYERTTYTVLLTFHMLPSLPRISVALLYAISNEIKIQRRVFNELAVVSIDQLSAAWSPTVTESPNPLPILPR
jgi:hypothetical protein